MQRMIFVFLVLTSAACDRATYTEVAAVRSELIGGIESYQNADQLQQQFQQWQVIENSSLDPGDRRPPFSIYAVAIDKYSHLGYSGTLRLRFFNNRLAEARFFPSDFEGYVGKLKETSQLRFNVTKKSAGTPEAFTPPHTRIWVYDQPHLDPSRAGRYVGWADVRLEKEEKAWVMEYS